MGDEHIGEVGDTGNSRGPHLRFEYRKGGSPVDPSMLGLFRPPEPDAD